LEKQFSAQTKALIEKPLIKRKIQGPFNPDFREIPMPGIDQIIEFAGNDYARHGQNC
jgi:hypothetical protein